MNFRTGGWTRQVSRGSHLLIHTARVTRGRRKRTACQLTKSSCQRATQVILGVSVMTGKIRTAATKQICNGSHGCPSSQQLLGDPLVGNAPIGVRESLWNPQPLQPGLIDFGGRRKDTACGDHQLARARGGRRSIRGDGAGKVPYMSLGGLYQQSTFSRQANLCVQESHPWTVPIALAPEGFLVGEPGQPSQMTPVGAGQVAFVSVGQLSGDSGGDGRFQTDSADPNPSLEMAGARLKHHTGLMPIDSHPFKRGGIGVVQIQQNVAGVPVVSIGLNVHVTALTIANAQKSYGRLLAQLGGGPEAFARECRSGGVVNQSHQIEIVGHRRELSPDGVQREEQAPIKHKHKCRRPDSPYNTLMLYPRGRRRKSNVGNGGCQNLGLSQKRAQAKLSQNVMNSDILLRTPLRFQGEQEIALTDGSPLSFTAPQPRPVSPASPSRNSQLPRQ